RHCWQAKSLCRPMSVGAIDPVGITKASARNVRKRNARTKAITTDSIVSRNESVDFGNLAVDLSASADFPPTASAGLVLPSLGRRLSTAARRMSQRVRFVPVVEYIVVPSPLGSDGSAPGGLTCHQPERIIDFRLYCNELGHQTKWRL